jgi:hypothetical protein
LLYFFKTSTKGRILKGCCRYGESLKKWVMDKGKITEKHISTMVWKKIFSSQESFFMRNVSTIFICKGF